jgi:hypothetical protein
LSSKRLVAEKWLWTAGSAVLFFVVWALLDELLNLRYPARVEEPPFWYLLPSVDLTVVLALFAVCGWRRLRVPVWVNAIVAGLFLAVRVFRLSDGLIQQNYFRPIKLYLDLPLLPDLLRLLRSTVPPARLLVGGAALLWGLAALSFLTYLAVTYAQRFVGAGRWQRALFAGTVVLVGALYPLWPDEDHSGLHAGLFAQSVVPRLRDQARFAGEADQLRRAKRRQIAATQDRLLHTSKTLERLEGADVYLFFIESYGATVFRRPEHVRRLAPVHAAFASALGARGFSVATGLLDSPTYGGGSWLAHATMATGVPTKDGLDFALLLQTRPQPSTMAALFAQAGYHTVLVQPGTTRPWPEGEVHGFERKYYEYDLEYQGPSYAWATMPDQYVVDFIHRREVVTATRPLFIEYALVTSHAPWALQPRLVDDWARLEGGRVYREQRPVRFPITWSNLAEGGDAYLESIIYDFAVLQRYLLEKSTRPALFIILGDHQPPGAVTGDDPSPAVPVHVVSRDRALVELFASAGYVPGMNPPVTGAVPGMETFLPTLLELLSRSSDP